MSPKNTRGSDRSGPHRGPPPESLLLEQGAITADQLSRAVAERYGLDHVDLSVYSVDMAAANLISVNTPAGTKRCPSASSTRETLLVAMADPTNVLAVDDIQISTALACHVAVAAEDDIDSLIGRLNTLQSAVSEAVDRGPRRPKRTARSATWKSPPTTPR